MDPICVHEAGHAVVLKLELGRIPNTVVLAGDNRDAATFSGLGQPSNGHDATRFAAYFYAGVMTVKEAIDRDLLPDESSARLRS